MPRPPWAFVDGVVHLHEQLEDAREHGGCDPDSGVPYPEDDRLAITRGAQPDTSAGIGVLGGVRQQVADHLGQPHRVGVERQRLGR